MKEGIKMIGNRKLKRGKGEWKRGGRLQRDGGRRKKGSRGGGGGGGGGGLVSTNCFN